MRRDLVRRARRGVRVGGGGENHRRNVTVRSSAKPPKELFPPLVPVVQVADCAWSSVLWITAWPVDEDLADAAARFAKKLSAKLRTRCLTFMGEDSGGGQDLHVFDAGNAKLHEGWVDGDPLPDFFEQEGVYLPPCYALRKGKDLTLCAAPDVAARIVRADVVDIGDDPY